MLPTIEINVSEICQMGADFMRDGEIKAIGRTYCFNINELCPTLSALQVNLDGYLSKVIASGMSAKPAKSKIMFWYAPPHSDLFFLTVSSKNTQYGSDWLTNIPGFYESGSSFVRNSAFPFMYWNGQNLHRIYEMPQDYEAEGYNLSDFGSSLGLTIGRTDEANFSIIAKNKAKYWDYSAIPKTSEEIIDFDGRKSVLLHAFWQP